MNCDLLEVLYSKETEKKRYEMHQEDFSAQTRTKLDAFQDRRSVD